MEANNLPRLLFGIIAVKLFFAAAQGAGAPQWESIDVSVDAELGQKEVNAHYAFTNASDSVVTITKTLLLRMHRSLAGEEDLCPESPENSMLISTSAAEWGKTTQGNHRWHGRRWRQPFLHAYTQCGNPAADTA